MRNKKQIINIKRIYVVGPNTARSKHQQNARLWSSWQVLSVVTWAPINKTWKIHPHRQLTKFNQEDGR